jgi:hypothetical protein
MYFQDEQNFNFNLVLLYEQKLIGGLKQYVKTFSCEDYELVVQVKDYEHVTRYTHTYLSTVIFYGWNAGNIDFFGGNNFYGNNFKALESLIRLYFKLVKDDTYINVKIIQCEFFKRYKILFDADIFDALASVLVK